MYRPSITHLAKHGGMVAALPPVYLAPSLHLPMIGSSVQTSSFSTTPVAAGRGRDKSKNRGVSAIHRTGPKFKLSASKYPLPKPVAPKEMHPRAKTPDHGLWAFFPPSREALSVPEYDMDFGRPWSFQELREKNWHDLHSLWWVCVKERNRIASSTYERQRIKAGYGDHEANERDRAIQITQKGIKHVLRERWYAWEEANRMYGKEWHLEDEDSMEGDEIIGGASRS